MIKIVLNGKNESREHEVKFSLDVPDSEIFIDGDILKIDTEQFFTALFDYEHKRSAEISYLGRDYFKYFESYFDNKCIVNMLRAFAVTNGYLQFHISDFRNESTMQNFKIETARKYFTSENGNLLIDWTEKEEAQPQMFFIQKELLECNSSDIQGLYDLQLLQKYAISFGDATVNAMYVPFEYSDVNNLQIINKYSTWRKIVKGINREVNRLVNNWSHK